MITNPNPIGAVYEAAVHCVPCAEERFGSALYSRKGATDNGGETVTLLFSYSYEAPEEGKTCECGRNISTPLDARHTRDRVSKVVGSMT